MRNTKMSIVQNNVKHNNGGHIMSKGMVKQNVGNAAKHAYEATVKIRAIRNAGGCNNLNGHILEIMGADKTNLNPFNGLHETLVKSRTAHAVDSIVTKGGKIVQRVQYKDTAKSIGDTVRRVKDGQYNSVTLKGTSETAKVFNRYAEKHGLAKRMQEYDDNRYVIHDPFDGYQLVKNRLLFEQQEKVILLCLNAKLEVIHERVLFIGSESVAMLEPKEVFQYTLRCGASRIILIHNHPSGNPQPSLEDRDITQRLSSMAKQLQIELIDHLIIGRHCFYSFASDEIYDCKGN